MMEARTEEGERNTTQEHDNNTENAENENSGATDCIVEDKKTKIRKFLKCLEVSILLLIMLLLVGLFMIPNLFFALYTEDAADNESLAPNATDKCQGATPYSGRICNEVFTSLQTCYSGEPSLNIPADTDQDKMELRANQLISALPILGPTKECSDAIKPFLCLHLFGLCDSNDVFHTTLRGDCEKIRDDICSREWNEAETRYSITLPMCENLYDATDKCIGNDSRITLESNMQSVLNNESSDPEPIMCSSGFFLDHNNTGLCRPQCGEFNRKELWIVIPERIAICVCLITSVAVFILALTCQRSTLTVFPANLMVYLCGTTFLLAAVIFIGFFDDKRLFCSSEDQIYALESGNETAFCTFSVLKVTVYSLLISFSNNWLEQEKPLADLRPFGDQVVMWLIYPYSKTTPRQAQPQPTFFKGISNKFILEGVVFHYCLAQTCLWGLMHAVFLFWGLIFPFNYRRLRVSGRMRYAHIVSVLMALTVPLPGALVPLKKGFFSSRNPTLACIARNADNIYYFLILPISVILGTASCLMVVTIWVIFKEFVLKKLIAKKKVSKVGKAEIKMAVIVLYYIIVGVLSLYTFTYFEVKAKANRDSLADLFFCESSGNLDCRGVDIDAVELLYVQAVVVIVMVALFPVVALLFSYDTKTYRKIKGSLKLSRFFTKSSSI